MVKLGMSQTRAMGTCHVGTLEWGERSEMLKTLATLMKHVDVVERVIWTPILTRLTDLSAAELRIHAMLTRHVRELG